MKRCVLPWIGLLVIGFALGGCATGSVQVGNAIRAASPNTGRIFIYRTSMVPLEPEIRVDGKKRRHGQTKGVPLRRLTAGEHRISLSTEVTRTLAVDVEKGQVRYVRLSVSKGFLVIHFFPELVDPVEGAQGLKECSYTGPSISQ